MDTKFENTDKSLVISGPNPVPLENASALGLLLSCSKFHAQVPLTRLRCRWIDNVYRYTFDAVDGRKWKQDLTISPGVEAVQSFTVADGWKESEFIYHRECRTHCINLVEMFGVTDIDV